MPVIIGVTFSFKSREAAAEFFEGLAKEAREHGDSEPTEERTPREGLDLACGWDRLFVRLVFGVLGAALLGLIVFLVATYS